MWHYGVTVRSNTWLQRSVTTGGNVNAWWWVPIGLAAWFLVAVVMALCIGAVLRRASRVRESLDRQVGIGAVLRRASQARESLDRQATEISDGTDPYTLKRNSTTSPSRMT